jgi:hypothetical protein
MMVATGWGGGNGELFLNKLRVLVLKDEKFY